MGTRDVDALWQELAMENEYRSVEVSRLLKKSMATGGASKKSSAKTVVGSRRVSATYSDPGSTRRKEGKHREKEEPFSLLKVLNQLTSEQRSVRKEAANALETQYLRDDTKEQTADKATACDAFAEMAKPLFKRFNDPVEKVRETCIRIATKCIAEVEDLLHYLPYLIPAITSRINSQYGFDEENQVFSRDQFLHDAFKRGRVYVAENQVTRIKPDEPSEEIRLLLLELLDAVLGNAFQRRASSILHAYIFDILLVLISGVHDDFHEVNIASCRILATMSNHMVSVMKHFSVATVRTLMPLLLHRLARVRVAVVETIRALVTCPNAEKCKGSGTEAIVDLIGHRDENVIPVAAFYTTEVRLNYFAKLDQDRNPMVRRAFFAMVSDWMINLPDRYDYESRLLPYLLSAVSDEDPAISGDALKTLEILGERYEQEHGGEVMEMKQYGVDGKNPTYNYRAPLPAPFTAGRPSLGTRLFVRGRARRFLNPILRELANWQESTRAHAVRLLKCVLVYCEETITVDVHLLVNTLLRAWGGDHDLLPELQQCADLTGRFTAPKTYLPLLLSRIRCDSDIVPLATMAGQNTSTVSQTATALEVLSYLLQGSLDKMVLPHVPEILETVSLPSILDLESKAVKLALSHVLLQVPTVLLEHSSSSFVNYLSLIRAMGVCASRRWPSLADNYEVDSPEVVLGEGSCSRVFRARERASGGLVAIKRLDKAQQRLIDDDPVQWQREVALLRRCASHPNVVALHDVIETSEFVYIVMELAEGGELFQALIDEGAYSEWDARRFIADLLEALSFLHGLGIVHRDVKPENLLLTSASPKLASIKLADFGLAALVEESSLLSNGRMTWAYCAPEVFKAVAAFNAPVSTDNEASLPKPARSTGVGVESDLWSVGVVLYVLLSGVHPFDADGRQTRDQMISNIQSGQFSMTGPRWDPISSEAKDLIAALLQVSPESRITAAGALDHEWFKSQRPSRQSLAVSTADTDNLEQYRHLMRRKFRTSVMAAVAADTLRRSLKRSRRSSGSVAGNSAEVTAEAPPNSLKIDQTTEINPVPDSDGVASPCPSSPASTSAAVTSVSDAASSSRPPVASHSVLKSIFHHESDSLEITAVTSLEAGVDDIIINV